MWMSWFELQAQIRPVNPSIGANQQYNASRFGGRDQGYDPMNSTFSRLPVDSTGVDSSRLAPEIKPDARWVLPGNHLLHAQETTMPIEVNLFDFLTWDEKDRIPGFTRDIGQVGKYFQTMQYGLDMRFFDQKLWLNEAMGRYNPYIISPESQVRYIDTKTPYVRINFMQGDRRLLNTDVTVSQNITPRLNATIFYERRRSESAYTGLTTGHTQIYGSTNFKSKNDRYHLFANGIYNEHSDNINGGEFRSSENAKLYQIQDGILAENDSIRSLEAFKKDQARVLLSDARIFKLVKSAYIDQYYHLIQPPDSVDSPHRLSLRNTLKLERTRQRFEDQSVGDLTFVRSHLVPVIPHLANPAGADTTINEAFRTLQFRFTGEAGYTFDGPFKLHVNGGLAYQRLDFQKDSLIDVPQNITEQFVSGNLDFGRIKANASIKQRTSDVFKDARTFTLGGALYPFPKSSIYRLPDSAKTDSVHMPEIKRTKEGEEIPDELLNSPLKLYGEYTYRDVMPTLFQSYWQPSTGSNFQPRPDLVNQQLTLLKVGAEYRFPALRRRKDTLLANFARAEAFVTRLDRMIYYTDSMQVRQAPNGTALTYIGANLSYRFRLFDKFYSSGDIMLSQGTAGEGADSYFEQYAQNIPSVHAKVSVFYHAENIKIAKLLRIGIDTRFFTSYAGMGLDPVSGEFFPVNYKVPPMPVVDVYLLMKLLSAHVFFKYSYVNENLFTNGYYTTPFYPALERTLTMGISWPFFD